MKLALKVGIDPDQFWKTTPYLLRLMIEARNEDHRLKREFAMWAAWHTGLFARFDVKLPEFSEVLRRIRPVDPRLDQSVMEAQLKAALMSIKPKTEE